MNNKESNALTSLLPLLVILLAINFMLPSNNSRQTYNNSNYFENNFDTVTVASEKEEATFIAKDITQGFDEYGKEFVRVRFRDEAHQLNIECDIPTSMAEQINVGTIYKGKVEVSYLKEAYDYAIKVNEGLTGSVYKATSFLSDSRAITDIDFMFSRYIISDIKDKNEFEEYITTKYLKNNGDKVDEKSTGTK